jgi:hypothetical protein
MGQDHLEEITRPSTGDIDGELTDITIFIANLGVCEVSGRLDVASGTVLEWKSSVEDDSATHSA